jgi:hypothetical protein
VLKRQLASSGSASQVKPTPTPPQNAVQDKSPKPAAVVSPATPKPPVPPSLVTQVRGDSDDDDDDVFLLEAEAVVLGGGAVATSVGAEKPTVASLGASKLPPTSTRGRQRAKKNKAVTTQQVVTAQRADPDTPGPTQSSVRVSRRGAKVASLAQPDVKPTEPRASCKRAAPLTSASAVDDIGALKVVELRKRLKTHNLPDSGRKAELVERLRAALAGQ